MPRRGPRAAAAALVLVVGACAPEPSAEDATPTARPTATADPLAGALAVFLTVSPGAQTTSIVVDGERHLLESTKYYVVRATAGQPGTQIDWTSSESFAKSYIYPITSAGRLFVVRAGTETLTKDLRLYDPQTGRQVASVCSFRSADSQRGFAIVGNRLFLRTVLVRDLFGNLRSGGDLAFLDLPCAGEPQVLVKRDQLPGAFELLSAGGQLYLESSTRDNVDLWHVNFGTGAVESFASLKRSVLRPQRVFEGDDALYFPVQGEGQLTIARLPPEGANATSIVARIPTRGEVSNSFSIDASGGEVYVALADPSPRFFLVGRDGRLAELAIERELFGTSAQGSGQILRLR